MKLVTARQMRDLDDAAIRGHGILSLDLMERAGRGVADIVRKRFAKEKGPIAIIVGKGNNGGDGLVAARHLLSDGFDVIVLLLESPSDLSPDARVGWEMLAPMTTHIYTATNTAELNSRRSILSQAACVIDAVLGTGLQDEVKGQGAAAIDMINSLGVPAIAVDIPSGLSADDGRPLGRAVRATATATFGLPKRGLFVGEGRDYSGEVFVVDIGIPREETDRLDCPLEMLEPSMFKKYFGRRRADSHKGTYGHVVVYAGSLGHLGAGYLACLAALRSGSGLATYCLPEKAFVRFDAGYAEIMCDPIPDDGTSHFHPAGLHAALKASEGKSAAVIGPAIGTEPPTREFVNGFVRDAKIPLVIDADGLNVLDIDSVRSRRSGTILTPHPGEMARLIGKASAEVQRDRLNFAADLARNSGAIVVLKGNGTVVASPDGRAGINPSGNAGMATAGMGDALSGMIASFVAQGIPPPDAAMAAVYAHGVAGDMAAAEHGERALITSDVIRKIGDAIRTVEDPNSPPL